MKAQLKYSETLQKSKQAQLEATKLLKEAISEGAKELFEANPKLKAFKWAQYTPHFNDGDSCEFSVRGAYCKFEDTEEDAGDSGDGFLDTYDFENKNAPERKVIRDVNKLLSSMDDVSMEEVFGNHVEVIATLGEFDIREYNHD